MGGKYFYYWMQKENFFKVSEYINSQYKTTKVNHQLNLTDKKINKFNAFAYTKPECLLVERDHLIK